MTKPTIRIRVPSDVMTDLRMKYPKIADADLIRMTYNTSLLKMEVGLQKKDFKNNMGKFLYGDMWKK